jgi:hypothetical protein
MDPRDYWKIVLVVVAGAVLLVHAVFPRYEWRTAGNDGSIVIVYDRWTNAFQRAVYDEHGRVTAQEPFKPY